MPVEFHGGRLPPIPDKPRLRLSKYLTSTAPVAPPSVDYLSKVAAWPMYLNDKIGDCTCAGAGHIIEAESTYGQGVTQTVTDDDVLKAYEAVSGYDPATGQNDNGAVMQNVLSYWRKSGVGGHQILAFAEVDHTNVDQLHAAMSIFGSLYIGIHFPGSAMTQFNEGKPWDVVQGSRIEGGHAINGGWYDNAEGMWKIVTWGKVQPMTQAFWETYVEEAWVVVTPEWLDRTGHTPSGLDLHGLGQDLADLTGEPNPFPPSPEPTPKPTPRPTPTPGPSQSPSFFERIWAWLRSLWR